MERRKITAEELLTLKEYYQKFGLSYTSNMLDIKKSTISSIARRYGLEKPKIHVGNSIKTNNLQEYLDTSNTLTEVLRKMGLNPRGGNLKHLRKVIVELNMNLSVFNKNYNEWLKNKPKGISKKIELKNILVVNSKYNGGNLKKRLYDEGVKDRVCEECGQTEEWRGKKMSLILDHINGINNDNRLENLRILCPNCNATLDTHCRGHKGLFKQENIDPYLEKKKKYFNKYYPLYNEMINDIKKLGYVKAGKKYNVSDNGLRKRIKQLETYRKIFM